MMTLDEIDTICRDLPGCEIRYPFDSSPTLRAWCIGKRMFAWSVTDGSPLKVQVKASPELVPSLVANYDYIHPGYHMNKRHWITVAAEQCDLEFVTGLLEDAHGLVAQSLSKAARMRLIGD